MVSGKSNWRVTVRQLESLVRLSEALAKLECLEEVEIRHVKEARRLLSKSIVRVERPDIELNEEDAERNDMPMETEEEANASSAEAEMPSDEPPKKKLTLSYDEYKNISNTLVLYMRKLEDEGGKKKFLN